MLVLLVLLLGHGRRLLLLELVLAQASEGLCLEVVLIEVGMIGVMRVAHNHLLVLRCRRRILLMRELVVMLRLVVVTRRCAHHAGVLVMVRLVRS